MAFSPLSDVPIKWLRCRNDTLNQGENGRTFGRGFERIIGPGSTHETTRRAMDRSDLKILISGSSSGRRKPLSRSSRSSELRSEVVQISHVPSGISMEYELRDKRTKRQWQIWRESVIQEFVSELRQKGWT